MRLAPSHRAIAQNKEVPTAGSPGGHVASGGSAML